MAAVLAPDPAAVPNGAHKTVPLPARVTRHAERGLSKTRVDNGRRSVGAVSG